MARSLARPLIGAALCLPLSLISQPAAAGVLNVERGDNLQAVIEYARDGDTLILGPKTFVARNTTYVDPLCGNCLDPVTEVTASYGFLIKDKSLTLVGHDRAQTQLVTNSGYGVFFVNSPNSTIKNLTVTGGKRDFDGNATDAAIVVRNSHLIVEDCDIRGNDHRLDSVVVGIGGVFGREGAELTIRSCSISNNGWDGVALYRGASATVQDCLIEDGRGAGIGVTWDATCTAFRNEIRGYWKGIGAFGSSWVIARNNLVHENLGWGIIATGDSYMDITNNVVYHNGNCGVAPWSTDCRGRIVNNIIMANGWREYWVCPCVGLWNNGDWAKWAFSNNIVYANDSAQYLGVRSQTGFRNNLETDPLFIDSADFRLRPGSPGINAGDTLIYDCDGSVSDIGLYGGPQAWRNH